MSKMALFIKVAGGNMLFSFFDTVLLFIIYSFLGWCVEVAFVAVTSGKVVNRGFLNGPVCPIYGCGMVGVLMCLYPVKSNIVLLFIGGMIICSAVELFGGWILDKIFHMRWWDYSDKPLNVGGYICLPFSLMWGVAVVFAVKIVHAPIMFLLNKSPNVLKLILILIFGIIMAIDMVVTLKRLIGIKKSLGQLDMIAEELNKLGDQLKDVVGNSAIDIADKAEQQKEAATKLYDEKIQPQKEELARLYDEKILPQKEELAKRGNVYAEQLQKKRDELMAKSGEYIDKINYHKKHIFNTLPTLNKSGKSIKIMEYLKEFIDEKNIKDKNSKGNTSKE